MSSASHFFIIASYAVIAAMVAVVLPQSVGGVDEIMGYMIGICVFLTASLVHEILSRRQDMVELSRDVKEAWQEQSESVQQLHGLCRELADDLGDLQERVAEGGSQGSDAVIAEMKVLQSQLAQLAQGTLAIGGVPALAGAVAAPATGRNTLARVADMDDDEILQIVRSALEENRVDLYLQPIVSLPQRKSRYYEAFSRVRPVDGAIIAPETYLGVAEARGLISTIDNLLLLRCVQLLRRLERQNRKAGFFVNISGPTLGDSEFFPQFLDFLQTNRQLAASIVFELSQADAASAAPEIIERMDRLAALGYRFSVDNVVRLDLDFDRLVRQHVRFLKVPADLLLSDGQSAGATIHPVDLKEALRRGSVDLIADKIESEKIVLELLDFGVDFGQGYLFGAPRPAREEGERT